MSPPLPPPVPALAIFHSETNTVVISWPSPSAGWNLQQNNNLNGTNWDIPSESINDNGTNRFIIVDPLVGDRFYWLIAP